MTGGSPPEPVLGERFVAAVAYAVELHARQARKATRIPYLTHVMAVSSLVMEDGGTEDEAIAALLHDGPEDQGGPATLDEIERRFGPQVAAMVMALTDTLEDPKPPWRPRKEAYLAGIGAEPPGVLRICLADKLHNLRSIATDVDRLGESAWDRFHAGRGEQAWYFSSLLDVFEAGLPGSRNLPEFRRLVLETFAASS